MKHNCLGISGKTKDGKYVIKGIFKLMDTFGYPLVCSLLLLKERGWVVNWYDFLNSVFKSGWANNQIWKRIKYDVIDVYDSNYCDEILKRVQFYMVKNN